MKPIVLFVGLSIMVMGTIVCIFSYPDFSDLLNYKLQLERLGAPSNPFMQDIYQETVRQYNEVLITLMGSGGLLVVGLGVTIYGATKKTIPKRLVSPENRYIRHLIYPRDIASSDLYFLT